MRPLQVVAIAVFATLACRAVAAPPETLYRQHCAGCHDTPSNPRVPARSDLKAMAPAAIERALSSGVMAHQAANLDAPDREAVAKWLGSTASGPAITCTGSSPAIRARALTAANADRLQLKWAFGFPNATMMRSQPAVHAGRLFVGSQDGTVYALDAVSGCVYWSANTGAEIRSAIVIGNAGPYTALFFGDSAGKVTALDTWTGKQLWQIQADPHPAARITGAPVPWKSRLYIPVSSAEEGAALQPGYRCCTFRGSVLAVDAASGRTLWKSYTIPQPPAQELKTQRGTTTVGPSGAAVWSSPAIDAKRNALYVATGDNYSDPATSTSDAVIAFHLDTGKLLWSRQFTKGDAMNLSCWQPGKINCPDSEGPDFDFGAPPILAAGKLILSQKSGLVYAVDPDRKGRLLWRTRVAEGGIAGGIQWGPATDGENLYVAVSDMGMRPPAQRKPGGPRYEIDPLKGGGIVALRLSDGRQVWRTPAPGCGDRRPCSPAQLAAVTVTAGVVFSGSVDGHMRAYSAARGKILWHFDTARPFDSVNGVPARGGSIDVAGPVIAGGMLYVTSGYDFLGGKPGNVLLAFEVQHD